MTWNLIWVIIFGNYDLNISFVLSTSTGDIFLYFYIKVWNHLTLHWIVVWYVNLGLQTEHLHKILSKSKTLLPDQSPQQDIQYPNKRWQTSSNNLTLSKLKSRTASLTTNSKKGETCGQSSFWQTQPAEDFGGSWKARSSLQEGSRLFTIRYISL